MSHPTALIAEDEPILAQALAMQLGRLWPELTLLPVAQDGLQAVDTALAELPEVLFLDIQMPERNGLEVAETVAEQWPPDRALPRIVFVTAYDEYAVAAFERAAVDYVLKPVQPARLAVTCQRLREQLRWQVAAPGLPAAFAAPATAPVAAPAVSPTAPPAPSQPTEGLAPAGGPTTVPFGLAGSADPAAAALLNALHALYEAQAASQAGGGAATPTLPEPAQPPLSIIQAAVGTGLQLVPIEDVLYFEAADKYVRVVTAQSGPQAAELLIRTPLRELIPRLDAQQFWQIHRGIVVSVRAIDRVSRVYGKLRLHLRGRTETLEVSRMYAHLFKAM